MILIIDTVIVVNNTTVINNTNVTNTTNTTNIKIVTINFPTFDINNYFTPVGDIEDPLSLSTKFDFFKKRNQLENATIAYLKWTDEVVKIADDSFAKGDNTYDSGYNTKFRHVPTSVMKSIYEQDCRIDAGFSQVNAYYAAIDAKYNKVLIITGIVQASVIALTGLITTLIIAVNTACTVGAVASGGASEIGTAGPQVALTKTGAAIIVFITAIASSFLTAPLGLIKADLANRKADLEALNSKWQPTHAEAKIEVPRLSNFQPPQSSGILYRPGTNNTNNTNNINNTNNTNNTNDTEQIEIVTPGFEYTEKLSVSDINKIKTNALNHLNLHKWDDNYDIKNFMDWNPSSWTDKIPQPVWDPPKWNPPYGGKAKWYEFWKWAEIAGYAIWYGLEYGAYSVWYGLQWTAYGITYAAEIVAYVFYWLGVNVDIAIYNMTKYEGLSNDLNRLISLYN